MKRKHVAVLLMILFFLAFYRFAAFSGDKQVCALDTLTFKGEQYARGACVVDWAVKRGDSSVPLRGNPVVTAGQNIEDAVILNRLFRGNSPLARIKHPIYLEMGALDGIAFSNTLLLEWCHGWGGILIEAFPSNFEQLQKNRPCSITVGKAACPTPNGYVRMGGHSGVAYQITDSEGSDKTVQVPCEPLTDILLKHGITRVNFFSLDVEGAELLVLQTLDFSRIKVDVLMAETDMLKNARPQQGSEKMISEKSEAVRRLLASKGMYLLPKDPPSPFRNGVEYESFGLSISGSDVFVSKELFEYDQSQKSI